MPEKRARIARSVSWLRTIFRRAGVFIIHLPFGFNCWLVPQLSRLRITQFQFREKEIFAPPVPSSSYSHQSLYIFRHTLPPIHPERLKSPSKVPRQKCVFCIPIIGTSKSALTADLVAYQYLASSRGLSSASGTHGGCQNV